MVLSKSIHFIHFNRFFYRADRFGPDEFNTGYVQSVGGIVHPNGQTEITHQFFNPISPYTNQYSQQQQQQQSSSNNKRN